ncbi:gliding motility-associated C-terminal domain-containing protein [Mucilaginibacter segetis]|uniref:Gliding motility-associated C-terminal domain-containing protein n=1 Tax=Mucilaginibacter segetis TaxID=2793071 RepID=A0A934UNU7_9SPHI|nr:gliding motility-associated C-terminal domain-containing protein [Mucilaginibacter segetis]MBK0380470.1 gliding motility-associated C-terminal domain-containing protein [Mucilaginibacter segetis]
MKNFSFLNRYVLICLLIFYSASAFAQRNFATSQVSSNGGLLCVGCVVTNQSAAVDGNLQTASVLNVTLGIAAQTYQELIFPASEKVSAGTPVTIKLGSGNNLLDLTALGAISIRPYNGNSPAGSAITAATLLTAASNNNQVELTIVPSQLYDRVRITLNGGLIGALSSIYVYGGFYYGNAPLACNSAFDELHGISAGLLNLGVDVGGVANPQNAIDGDINTASTLNASIGAVGAYAQQTIIFQSPSVIGDSVRLTLSIPQALIDAGVFSNISLSTYNGNASNNDSQTLSGALLSVRLLDLNDNRRKVTVTYAPTKLFDRVQLRLGGGIANVLSSVNLYEAEKLIPRPVIKYNNVVTTDISVCSGSTAALTANTIPNTTFNWYTHQTGSTPVFTGTTFTTPVLTATTTYYVAAMRSGCTDESERTPITISVNQIPAAPVVSNANVTICKGSTATFNAQSQTDITVNWYTAATGGTPVFTGNSFTTNALSQNTSYYAEAVAGGTCISPARTQVTATVNAPPAAPALTDANVTICDGDVAVFSIDAPVSGNLYNWYTTAAGGTPVFTGADFTTPALHANTTYYVSTVNATGCESDTRSQASAVVQPQPADPVVAANNLTINAGQTATINITNTQTGITYNWYTSATASTPVFSGTSYTTPALFATTTYYVNAVNGSGCTSANRTPVTINVTINTNSPCTFANTQSNSANGICIGCTITNGALAADADTTTASTINVLAGLVGGYADQYLQFQQPGFAGDTVKAVISTPVGLADVNVAGRISVALYNGTTLIDRYPLDNALVKVRLLGGNNRYAVLVPATAAYDRIEVRLNSGVASLLTSLQIYYAAQQYPTPVFDPQSPEVCKGSTAQINISSPANGTFNWYTTPTAGSSVFTGTNFTTPPLSANTTYYIEYSRNGCVSPARQAVQVLVNDPPAKPVVMPSTATIFSGQTASFTAQATNNVTVKWYSAATGGTPLFTGKTFTTPPLTTGTTYYAESSIGNCVSDERTPATVVVNAATLPDVTVNPPTQSVNSGSPATLTASSTTAGAVFNWYTTPTGGTSIYTGATFNTPAIFNDITYYAEATIPATGAVSATRAAGAVTVNAIANNPVPCDAAIAQTNTTSGLACVLCSISNANGSVDNNRDSFSQLNVPIGIGGGYAQQTLRFANIAHAGDSVVVELGFPATLADVSVLSQISLATYNGTTFNNDRFAIDGAAISIKLLNGISRFRVAFKAAQDFDRVETRLNSGLAGVFNSLNIYDASQEVAAPVINAASVTACQGTQATLTATVPAHVTVKWYTTASGGTPIFTGTTFNTPALNSTTTYYAEASRTADGCTQSVRSPVRVNITPIPAAPVVNTATVTVCSNQPATFTAEAVSGVTFNWYTLPASSTPVFTGNPFTTDPLTISTDFYVEAVGSGECGSSIRTKVTANVTSTPLVPTVSQSTVETCSGSNATLSASSSQSGITFNWFTTPTGGTPVYTGAQYTTPVLTSTTSYYVEAASGSCVSPARAEVTVTVNPVPIAPTITVTPSGGQISSGQTATLMASSTTAGATFNWYTSASGGTPIFTGATFTTPALTSNTTYYVESMLTATGCTSPERTAVTITVNPIFSTSCDFAVTQTTDVNGLCIGCSISNPNNAVDADTTSFSQVNVPVSVVGAYAAQTLIFSEGGVVGDTVKVKIGIPVSLLTAGVLDQLQIASYNGATYNGDRVNLSSSVLRVQILSGGNTALVKFAPSAVYDRIEVRLSSNIASLFSSLNLYFATKQVEAPVLDATTVNICAGNTATFTIANTRTGISYNWYTSATGGTPVFTGNSFVTGPLTATTTYYVESSRTSSGCANPNRVAATVNVTPLPANPVLAQADMEICQGESTTLSVTNTAGSMAKWYDAAVNGTLLFTGANYTVSPVTTNNYYVELTNGTCSSSVRTIATVTVNPRPAKPAVASANVQVCAGSTANLQVISPEAGVTYNWYTAATGGTAVFSGSNFTTDAITQNTTYYVEAANTTSGCNNNGDRTAVNVTVNGQLNTPTLSAAQTEVCSGGSATLSVVNPVSGVQYNWYTAATGGTLVHTGVTFTINDLTADIAYFVEAANNGCTSAARAEADITVLPVPTPPQLQIPSGGLTVCMGSSATIVVENPQTNFVYRWYDAPTNGTLLFTGTQFTTPALTANTTYYVEASSAGNCNPSSRTSVTITITPLPQDPTVTTPNVLVCNGSSATLSISSPQSGITYLWYDSPSQTNLLFTGETYVTDPITVTTNFYVVARNAGGCASNNLAQVQVTTEPAPDAPVVANNNTATTCSGTQATLSIDNPDAGFTYNWYAVAHGGTILHSGTDFVTPGLSANTTYYAEAVNENGCVSNTRTAVSVTVTSPPNAPVINTQGLSVCPGDIVTINATAGNNTTINWYASATGGTLLFTGTSFVTPAINATTTYYAEAVSNSSGCSSATRTAVTVNILQHLAAPVVTVGNTTSTSITFEWGAVPDATGYEVSLDNGQTFTTPSSGSAGLIQLVVDLQPAESVTIIVRAAGSSPCQLSSNSTAVTGTTANPFGDGIFVPNAFTPNGDGNNDIFQIYGTSINHASFWIYDQWGELQFKSTNKSNGWDGTFKGRPQPVGVYVYYVEATMNDGQVVKKKGTVTLLR